MIPIHEEGAAGSKGYSLQEFEERFLEICAEHQNAGRALAFAFLLFDVDSPEFGKMLADADYWRALDRISGKYLSVFSVVTHQPRSEYAIERRGMEAISAPDAGMKLQLVLNSYFDIKNRVELPAILLFQVDGGQVSGSALVQLHSNTIEAAFNEIRDLLRDLAEGLSESVAAGHRDPSSAFDAISARLRKRKVVRFFSKGAKVLTKLSEIVGLVSLA